MADIRETAKAEAERRYPYNTYGSRCAELQAGYVAGWKARGEADAEAALRQIQLSSLIGARPVDFEKGVLSAAAAIRALDEGGR